MQTTYNAKKNYFKICCEYEKDQAKCNGENYDPEIMLQINSALGFNTRHHHEGGVMELQNLNLHRDEQNKYWHNWHNVNMKSKNTKIECSFKEEYAEYQKLNNKKVQDENIWAFITVGFDDEKIVGLDYDLHMKKIVNLCWKIAHKNYKPNAIKKVTYVIEKHRKSGIHHHAHFLFEFNIKVPPSDMRNKIISVADAKEYTKLQFIQYDGPQKYDPEHPHAPFEVYYEYVRGNKCEEKLSCVQFDDQWRDQMKINKLYIVE